MEHDFDPEDLDFVRDRVGDVDRVVFFTLLRRFTLLRVLTRRSISKSRVECSLCSLPVCEFEMREASETLVV